MLGLGAHEDYHFPTPPDPRGSTMISKKDFDLEQKERMGWAMAGVASLGVLWVIIRLWRR